MESGRSVWEASARPCWRCMQAAQLGPVWAACSAQAHAAAPQSSLAAVPCLTVDWGQRPRHVASQQPYAYTQRQACEEHGISAMTASCMVLLIQKLYYLSCAGHMSWSWRSKMDLLHAAEVSAQHCEHGNSLDMHGHAHSICT